MRPTAKCLNDQGTSFSRFPGFFCRVAGDVVDFVVAPGQTFTCPHFPSPTRLHTSSTFSLAGCFSRDLEQNSSLAGVEALAVVLAAIAIIERSTDAPTLYQRSIGRRSADWTWIVSVARLVRL
jgi:hypothetical protein